ncbi:hypothetical protein MTR_1g035510 [Medicago truncatula]|uniref:Transcription factor B3-Domain family n=1 Tax=Medicago truncatula TaxID=3880 RepID=A0A072VGT7_MEDTR|nr:hypothetical protein MTR_1g035510 [Medicago truncatula]
MVPRNFVDKYWKGMSNPISLKFPNGYECKMFWIQLGDDVWFLNWKRFARSLRYGDLLVFQYKGGSDFYVIILDDSKLEIDYSSMQYNDDHDSNKHCKLEESDDDCIEILNDIATNSATPHGTNIDKTKFNMNATKQNVSGYEGRTSSCKHNTGKRKLFAGTSSSRHVLSDSEGPNVMKQNTFELVVNSSYPCVPNEFLSKHEDLHGKFVELKVGGKSWALDV